MSFLALLKAARGWVFSPVVNWLRGKGAQWVARHRAMRGQGLAAEASMEHLVRRALASLARSQQLPPELNNDGFRRWLQSLEAARRFEDVVLAKVANQEERAAESVLQLSLSYEQLTGNSRALAAGPIALVADDVLGQLTATAAASQALQLAVHARSAMDIRAVVQTPQEPYPNRPVSERFRALAAQLVDAARKSWEAPDLLVPLVLETQSHESDTPPRLVTESELIEAIDSRKSIVLHGDGGIGKTTLVLQLATSCLDSRSGRTPMYVDAAAWARTHLGIADYLAGLPSAQGLRLNATDLVQLAASGDMVLMVNGWNEIPANCKSHCTDAIRQLCAAAPLLTFVVATRTVHDAPKLPYQSVVAVRGLTWSGQAAFVHAELPSEAAARLLERLSQDSQLRYAARSPLILRGLVASAGAGDACKAVSVFDLLEAVVVNFERNPQRQSRLIAEPILGFHARYLEELAWRMNALGSTIISRDAALATLGAVAAQLAHERLLGAAVQPALVLDTLASQHLLQSQGGGIRFAHQRFQEYFVARRLLNLLCDSGPPSGAMYQAINEPFWSDSFALVAGKLKTSAPPSVRAKLVRAANTIDVSYACELAGRCGYVESDDAALHQQLVSDIHELDSSSLPAVNDLAVACKIASRLPVFREDLWALMESEDQQTRLHTYRLSGMSVSLRQLGDDSTGRMRTWRPERRAEFIHEAAGNPENYEFIVDTASSEPNAEVRAAAIAALFWDYPASPVGVETWLEAPVDVQTRHDLISCIAYEFDRGLRSEDILAQLRKLAVSPLPDDVRLRLALAFPSEVGASAVDIVLERLKSKPLQGEPHSLLSIAEHHAPARLRELARELIDAPRSVPDWASHLLLKEPPEQRAAAFERVWSALQASRIRQVDAAAVGPLADMRQTERSFDALLRHRGESSRASSAQSEMAGNIARLVAYAPGDDVLNAVLGRGVDASYEESVELVRLLHQRITQEEGRHASPTPWAPSVEQVDRVIAIFREKPRPAHDAQDALFIYLACVAADVAPARYGQLLLEAFRRHLDAWTTFQGLHEAWRQDPRSPRPINPCLGEYIASALLKWGIDALPGLLGLLTHPNAELVAPRVIARIVMQPWSHDATGRPFHGIGGAAEMGLLRREKNLAFLQPVEDYQPVTDAAALALAEVLEGFVTRHLVAQRAGTDWNPRLAAHEVGNLTAMLASIPSPSVLEPVLDALKSGLLDLYQFVDVAGTLLRQGWCITDRGVVVALEALFEREASSSWLDAEKKSYLARCCQLVFLVEPLTLLSQPLSHYLCWWKRLAHPDDLFRQLGGLRTETAWEAIIHIANELAPQERLPSGFAAAVASALSFERLGEFAGLIAQGALERWRIDERASEDIASSLAKAAEQNSAHLSPIIDACRQRASAVTDTLLFAVLEHVGDMVLEQQSAALEALDAGRAQSANAPAFRAIRRMFSRRVPPAGNSFEVQPRSCNELRQELYARAKDNAQAALASRQLLAWLECTRRESGRPIDETRHPAYGDGQAWTCSLGCTAGSANA